MLLPTHRGAVEQRDDEAGDGGAGEEAADPDVVDEPVGGDWISDD